MNMAMSISNLKEQYRRRMVKSSMTQSRTDSAGFVLVEAILNEIRYMLKELESRQLRLEAEKNVHDTVRVDYSWLKTSTSSSLRSSPKSSLQYSVDETGSNSVTLTNQQRLFSDIENLCLTLTSAECGHVLKAFEVVHEAWDRQKQNKPVDNVDVCGAAQISKSIETDSYNHESVCFTSTNTSLENLISSSGIDDPHRGKVSSSFLAKLSPSRVLQGKNSLSKGTKSGLEADKSNQHEKDGHKLARNNLFLRPSVPEDCSEMLSSSEDFLRGVHKIIINIVAQRQQVDAKSKPFSRKLHHSRGKSRWPVLTRSFISRSLEGESRGEKTPETRMASSWSNLKIRPGSRAAVMPSDKE